MIAKHKPKKKRESKKKPSSFLKFIKVTFWVIIFSLFGVVFSYIFVFPSFLKSVGTSENILFVSSSLDGDSSAIYIAHISPNQDENSLYILNGNQKIDVSGGYGEYELSSVYSLLEIDKKGDQYIKSVFSRTLKLPIDDIVTTKQALGIVKQSDLSFIFAKESLSKFGKFDLDFIKSLKLHYLASSFELEKYDSLEELENDLYKLSTLDSDVYQYCSVAVVNTTSENGLARNISKLVENTGAMVVKTEGSDEELKKTIIYYSDEMVDCSRLVNNIVGIFPTKPLIKHIDELSDSDQYRSRVVIKVGSDTTSQRPPPEVVAWIY